MTSFDPNTFLNSSYEEPARAPPSRVWSPLQDAIFQEIKSPDQPIIIQAVAGSGKTTTLVEALRYAPGSALFMAFNKSIALDIASKVPRGDVKTLNALGHQLWMQNSPSSKFDPNKLHNITKSFMSKKDYDEIGYQVRRMVGVAKNSALDIDGNLDEMTILEAFLEIAEANDSLPVGTEQDAAIFASRAFFASRDDRATFDFDDQLYMPLYLGWEYPHYYNVLIDEAQDLSPIQHFMLQAFYARGARIVAVGDRHQAIYAFRGADTASMDNLKTRFRMLELPLSVSYRCPRNVIQEARQYCSTIEWRDNAPEGTVEFRDDHPSHEDPHLFARELVVCRNNAPLFRAILRHVRAKAPCRVLSNFIESLQGFIRGFKCSNTSALLKKVEEWEANEIEKARKKNQAWKEASVRDKAEAIKVLCSDLTQTRDVIELLKALGRSTSGPTFSTIHKAKGLEADQVYILRPDLVPSPFAEGEAQKRQERNLAYVAITRAKDKLTYGCMR